MEIYLFYTLLIGIGISLCASSIGCFVVWQKMSYFGDSLSHSILVGIILGLCFNLSPLIGGLLFAVIFGLLLNILGEKYSKDSIIGIIAQTSLAITIIINTYMKEFKLDLNSYLFGDILASSSLDIIQIYIILIFSSIWIYHNWNSLMLIIISKDLAHAENIKVNRIRLQLILLIAIIITFSIKIVGALLINALLIIPANAAKILSNSPKKMIIYSSLISIFSTITGIYISLYIDVPTAPMIIVVNFILFIMINIKFNLDKVNQKL